MILIISTCSDPLSELEFVKPIEKRIPQSRVVHYSKPKRDDLSKSDKIIVCGTALKDFGYLEGDWSWLKDFDRPVLGICAGAHVLAKVFGGDLTEDVRIGVHEVKAVLDNKLCEGRFNAYFLHSKNVKGDFKVLAKVNSKPAIIKHHEKEIYGVIFHPEVMNSRILDTFLKL